MNNSVRNKAERLAARQRGNARKKKAAAVISCVAIFCIVYALTLPAITMESAKGVVYCGEREHTHDENCYSKAETISASITCGPETGSDVDYVVHKHDTLCYDASGKLICTLKEIEEHQHDDSCYSTISSQPAGHQHDDSCYEKQLICEEPEVEGHVHTDACYSEEQTCGLEEHQHDDACYSEELDCGQDESEEHSHTDACYIKNLTCSLEEHSHTDACNTKNLTCTETEAGGHQHDENCYEKVLVCTLDEQTDISSDSDVQTMESILVCSKPEVSLHTHQESCYDGEDKLICTRPEVFEHEHTEECVQKGRVIDGELTCTLEEHVHTKECYVKPAGDAAPQENGYACGKEEHTHTDACYSEVLSCGLEESEEHTHEDACYRTELTCGLEEHTHSDACTPVEDVTPENNYTCGKEEHTHTDACKDETGELICGLEEHTHSDACTSAEAVAPENNYTCGKEEHTHTDACKDESGELICGLEEHTHSDVCTPAEVVAPEDNYTCGKEEHTHTDACKDESGELICGLEEHTHSDACTPAEAVAPEDNYPCGKSEHSHTKDAGCYDENGNLICKLEEHTHSEECFYVCGKETHTHTDACFDEEGNAICGKREHTHTEACKSGDGDVDAPEIDILGDVYVCGKEAHTHTDACKNESGELICGLEEHTHSDACKANDANAAEPTFPCGMNEHEHEAACYDGNNNRICGLEEHEHSLECLFACGKVEHKHEQSCYDEEGNATCGMDAHTHTLECVPEEFREMVPVTLEETPTVNTDLKPYLTQAKITVDAGTNYEQTITIMKGSAIIDPSDRAVNANNNFSVALKFENIQLAKNADDSVDWNQVYTYQLPEGIHPLGAAEGTIKRDKTDVGDYEIDEHGLIRIKWRQAALEDSVGGTVTAITVAGLTLDAQWDKTQSGEQKLEFSEDLKVDVNLDFTTKLAVNKWINSNGFETNPRAKKFFIQIEAGTPATGVTVTDKMENGPVTSTGDNGGKVVDLSVKLKVGDKITISAYKTKGVSGSAQTTIRDVVNRTEEMLSKKEIVITEGMDLTAVLARYEFDMSAGDIVEISYPVEISEDASWVADRDGLTITATNEAKVNAKDLEEEIIKKAKYEYTGEKNKIIQKTADDQLTGDTAKWTLKVNQSHNRDMRKGGYVFDELKSDNLEYNTEEPIRIEIIGADGRTLKPAQTISWEDVLLEGNRSWKYDFSNRPEDEAYCSYVITYKTKLKDTSTGVAMENSAGSGYSNFPGTGIIGEHKQVDVGIIKEGQVNNTDDTVLWTVQYEVKAGASAIEGFSIEDNLSAYDTIRGEKTYPVLVQNNKTPLDTSASKLDGDGNIDYTYFQKFCRGVDENASEDAINQTNCVFAIRVTNNKDNGNLTDDNRFAGLKLSNLRFAGHPNSDGSHNFYFIIAPKEGFVLPAAQGDLADGYTITLKYTTVCPEHAGAATVVNLNQMNFIDPVTGKAEYLQSPAKVGFTNQATDNMINVEKTGTYNATKNKVEYKVRINNNQGQMLNSTGEMVWTDRFDSKLEFADAYAYTGEYRIWNYGGILLTTYYVDGSTGGAIPIEFPAPGESNSGTAVQSWEVKSIEGSPNEAKYQVSFPNLELPIVGIPSVRYPVEFTVTVNNAEHTLTLEFPREYGDGNGNPITWDLEYQLTPVGTVKGKVDNTFTVTDGYQPYGEAHHELEVESQLSQKSVKFVDEGEDINRATFNIDINFGDERIQQLDSFTILDSMSNNLNLVEDKFELFLVSVDGAAKLNLYPDYDDFLDLDVRAVESGDSTKKAYEFTFSLNDFAKTNHFPNFLAVYNNFWSKFDPKLAMLRVSYKADIEASCGSTASFDNSAILKGYEANGSEVKEEHYMQFSDAYAIADGNPTVKIKKMDPTNKVLDGAIFDLYECSDVNDETGTRVATGTTATVGEESGIINFMFDENNAPLKYNQPYYVVETKAPDGYILNGTHYKFFIEDWRILKLNAEKNDMTKLGPEKVDEWERKVSEYNAEGQNLTNAALLEQLTEAADNLEKAGYTRKLTSGTIEVRNYKTVSLTIRKLDGKDEEKKTYLADAEFAVWKVDGNGERIGDNLEIEAKIGELEGVYIVKGLEPGCTYHLQETKAPETYQQDATLRRITVSDNDADRGKITIEVQDGDTWKPAPTADVVEYNTYNFSNDKMVYRLPESGGTGIGASLTGGMALLTVGLLCVGLLRYRKKGGSID